MSVPPSFWQFLTTPMSRGVIGMTVLIVLVMIGSYVVKKFRDGIDDDRDTAGELLRNFREMNRGGDISDAEFRTIRTVLGDRLQSELKESGDEG